MFTAESNIFYVLLLCAAGISVQRLKIAISAVNLTHFAPPPPMRYIHHTQDLSANLIVHLVGFFRLKRQNATIRIAIPLAGFQQ
jgi:hypothetical protein